MPVSLPKMFAGRYRIVKPLGEGGMGAVFLAEDTRMRRPVALKVPQFASNENPEVIKRFYREARIAAGIRHSGICPVHDVDCHNGTHYLTMAFIEGTPLTDHVRSGQPWTPPQAVELVLQLASALEALHGKGIVHRDLKPGNIILQEDGTPVLLDFGLARSITAQSQRLTASGATMGTPAYMAPEQIEADAANIGTWTDVYALGTILFQLLTGRVPFTAASLTELYGKVLCAPRPRPSELGPGIDAELDAICLRTLAIAPRERPGSMAELTTLLTTWRSRQHQSPTLPAVKAPVPVPRPRPHVDTLPSTKTRRPKPARRKALLLGTAVLFCLLTIAAALAVLLNAWPDSNPTTAAIRPTTRDELPPPGAAALAKSFKNSIGMEFVLIPRGRFMMGTSKEEREQLEKELTASGWIEEDVKKCLDVEQPQHEVEITQPFYMGVYEVTQEEYEKVMGKNPSCFCLEGGGKDKVKDLDTKRFPVEIVSHDDAITFLEELNNKEKETGRFYRLPTEAEWEYACRGGATKHQVFHFGDRLASSRANFHGNHPYGGARPDVYLERPTTVGSYKPNGFGLHDMHGNIWEWCSDWYDEKEYQNRQDQKITKDPQGPDKGTSRVMRGGTWNSPAGHCRSALRDRNDPGLRYFSIGFRVVCVRAE